MADNEDVNMTKAEASKEHIIHTLSNFTLTIKQHHENKITVGQPELPVSFGAYGTTVRLQ